MPQVTFGTLEWKGWVTLAIVGVGFVCMLLELTGPDFIMLVSQLVCLVDWARFDCTSDKSTRHGNAPAWAFKRRLGQASHN